MISMSSPSRPRMFFLRLLLLIIPGSEIRARCELCGETLTEHRSMRKLQNRMDHHDATIHGVAA